MRLYEFGVGKIVKGVNTTVDVGVDEITKQAKKFGNKVDRDGNPPVNPGGKINLKETMDRPYSWEWVKKSDQWWAIFQGKNEKFKVYIDQNGHIMFIGSESGVDISNNGDAFQIFATVGDIVKSYISNNDVGSINFSAKEPSRLKLYGKFANMLAKKIGWEVTNNGDKFIISKPVNLAKEINEAVDYTWVYDTSAKFKVNGMMYNVDFIPISNTDLDAYDVEFSAVHGPRFNNSGMMGQSSIQVFSTVIQTMGDFISKQNPDMLVFTGDKSQNRVDVYTKMIRKFEDQLANKGYSVDIEPNGKNVKFIITKNNESK